MAAQGSRLSESLFPSEGKFPRAYWETNISGLLLYMGYILDISPECYDKAWILTS